MKLNDKNVASFAVCSSPIDKEGYLSKKGDLNKGYQRRWFVLKGNLLFYFEKKQDKEPLGVIVLEACSVQASIHARYAFDISFDGLGTRTYILLADNDEDMQSWMKVISHASYEYLRSIVDELQRRVNLLTSSSKGKDIAESEMSLLHVGPAKGVPSLRYSQSQKESGAKVKVQNGILVDLNDDDDEAPPIPPKMKSQTMHGTGRKLPHSQDLSRETSPEAPPIPSKQRTVQLMRTLPPHSSPVIPPGRINPVKPLSPASTLDRTPVLQPTTINPEPSTNGTKTGSVMEHPLVDVASSHPPPHVKKQLAAPPDPKKSMDEMHEEFTQAMHLLRTERTSGNASNPS